jgi:hypothetical protein
MLAIAEQKEIKMSRGGRLLSRLFFLQADSCKPFHASRIGSCERILTGLMIKCVKRIQQSAAGP